MLVVVPYIDAEDTVELSAAKDQQTVEAFPAYAADPALDVRVRVRRLQWRSDDLHPCAAKEGVKGAAELRIPVVDQKPGLLAVIVKVHQQVARLLQHPRAVRVARTGDALDAPAADTDEDEHVQPAQQYGVDGKKVAGGTRGTA